MWPNVLLSAIAGLGAVILMTLFEFPFWRKWGLEGVAEWQMNSIIVSRIGRRSGHEQRLPMSWIIVGHLFHGSIAGIVFGLFLPVIASLSTLKLTIPLSAIIYSTFLWIIFSIILRGAFESAGGISISSRGVFVALLSHLVYGFFLGLFTLLIQSILTI